MLTRATDAIRVNEIINHPDVRPNMLFDSDGPIDLSGLVKTTLILMSENGGFLFAPVAEQAHARAEPDPAYAFELHSFFLPEGRGREAHGAAWEAAEYIFTRTQALAIYTLQPTDAPGTRPPKSMGFAEHFKRNIATRGQRNIACAFWRLDIWDWAARVRGVEADGEEFHTLLNAKREALGLGIHAHEHDPAHDRYVGIAVRMWKAGNVLKAIRFLNYWSRWAGTPQMRVLGINADEIAVDLGDGVIIGKLDRFQFEIDVPPDQQPPPRERMN